MVSARYIRVTRAKFFRYVGARIRHYRKARGMSQATLGARLGTTMYQVSHWECGRRPVGLDTAIEIAMVLGVELADLVSFRGKR